MPKTIEDYIKDGRAKYELTSYGHYFLNQPRGYDVGYHSLKPRFEGQTISQEHCDWLNGKPCYSDGSGLRADDFLQIVVEKGSDEIWKLLEKYYKEMFKN